MIVVRVAVQVKPEERGRFLEHVEKETKEIRVFEGLLTFKVAEDPFKTNSFMLYEEWQSKEAFDAYRYSGFFKQNGQTFTPMFSAKPDSAYFEAERIKT